MKNREGAFLGHSVVQNQYLDKIKRRFTFHQKGQTLWCKGQAFPVAMARELNTFPRGVEASRRY